MKENNSDGKGTILVIVTGLVLLGLVFKNNALIWAGIVISIVSMLSVKIESLIIHAWMKLAFVLGWINSRILLTIIFYLFLVPLSLLKRLFSSQDPLKLKKPENSLWIIRDHEYTKEDMEEPF